MQWNSVVATGQRLLALARTVAATAQRTQLSFLAADIAYYVLLSLFPLGLLALVVVPDASVDVRGALPGTFVAAIGWTLLGSVFTVYAAIAGSSDLYG